MHLKASVASIIILLTLLASCNRVSTGQEAAERVVSRLSTKCDDGYVLPTTSQMTDLKVKYEPYKDEISPEDRARGVEEYGRGLVSGIWNQHGTMNAWMFELLKVKGEWQYVDGRENVTVKDLRPAQWPCPSKK